MQKVFQRLNKSSSTCSMAEQLFSHSNFYLPAITGNLSSFQQNPGKILGQSRVQGVERVKVLFMADSPLEEEERCLLDNVIKAMKLAPEEASFQVMGQSRDQLMDAVYSTQASYIVTLGAYAGNFLLRKNERLTDLRGRLYLYVIQHPQQNLSVKILTLFHPNFLLINPSMKAVAWSDLQLILNDEL